MGFEKRMGGGSTSVVQYCFDKGVQTSIMPCPDADLIVEVLHVPRIQKVHMVLVWGLQELV